MAVYLLCFSEPIGNRAKHYIGFAKNADSRFQKHLKGEGARLTQVAIERGITFEKVRVWDGDRKFERKLKNQKNAKRFCPKCNKRELIK